MVPMLLATGAANGSHVGASTLFLIIAVVLFAIAALTNAVNYTVNRANFVALGLFFFALSFLF